MECFRLLFDHLAWIKHQFLRGIRDSRKAGSLWGMMRGVRGVRKSIHQRGLAKGLVLGLLLYVKVLREFRKRLRRKRPTLFKSVQCHFHQANTPVHHYILVTDNLTNMGIKTVPQLPHSPYIAPSDFWVLPKLSSCHYETVEEIKDALTKDSDTLTQENFFQKLLER